MTEAIALFSLFLSLSLSDVLGILGVIELPFTIFGGYFVFRRIMKHKKVEKLMDSLDKIVDLLPDVVTVSQRLLEEYKKNNGHSE